MGIWCILWAIGVFYGHLVYFWPFGILYDHLEYCKTIWYSFWPFGIVFPVLVSCAKKTLATLIVNRSCGCRRLRVTSPLFEFFWRQMETVVGIADMTNCGAGSFELW
jgi:hypothetical protein